MIAGKDGRVVLQPDGTRQDIYAMSMTLGDWQKAVGGYVEAHRVVIGGRVCQVLMDEDAIMKGVPVNPQATELLTGLLHIAPPGMRGPVIIAWGKGKLT